MSLDILRARCGRTWPAIAKASKDAVVRFEQIREIVKQSAAGGAFDSADISVVVFGSLARGEWTSGSDLDWTLLIDGEADHEHARTATALRQRLQENNYKPPGPTGVFGSLTFSHDLIHLIGGQDDTNHNTTQRMLLLLESRPIHNDSAYDRVVRGILNRYLENDFRQFRWKVPRFLQNDLHRFWRTMCVDYANKYWERAGAGWATRIIKLRMSRKLIFAAGLLMCFSCHPELVKKSNTLLAQSPSVELQIAYLRTFVQRTPLDIIGEFLEANGNWEIAAMIVDSYYRFLAVMDDGEKRKHLETLPANSEEKDPTLEEMIEASRKLEMGLQRLFFDDNPLLAQLTRDYGIF